MKKRILLILFVVLCCVVLSSCRTPEVKVEYVPVELDIQELIQPIVNLRPEDVRLIDPPETLSDIMSNSVAFQFAYESWKDYAVALENFYLNLGDKT